MKSLLLLFLALLEVSCFRVCFRFHFRTKLRVSDLFFQTVPLPDFAEILVIVCIYILGEIIQHELQWATIGFMFTTIIRHIKSLQKSKCIIHQLNGCLNSQFNIRQYDTLQLICDAFDFLKRFNVPDDYDKHETNGSTL